MIAAARIVPSATRIDEGSDPSLVLQRSEQDCLLCVFAMFAGLSYEAALALAQAIHGGYDPGSIAMTHSLMRRMADARGMVLLSSIYMDWRYPGIVGVASLTIENCGHALYWTGERLLDPGGSGRYDRDYIDRAAIEFTQRADHLGALITLQRQYASAAGNTTLNEYF